MNCQIVSHTAAVFVHLSISVYLCFSTMDTQVLLSLYCHDTASTKWHQHLGLHIKSWGECCDGADKVPGQCWGAAAAAAFIPQDIKRLTTSTVISCVYSTLVKPRLAWLKQPNIFINYSPKWPYLLEEKSRWASLNYYVLQMFWSSRWILNQLTLLVLNRHQLPVPHSITDLISYTPGRDDSYESTGSCAPHNL